MPWVDEEELAVADSGGRWVDTEEPSGKWVDEDAYLKQRAPEPKIWDENEVHPAQEHAQGPVEPPPVEPPAQELERMRLDMPEPSGAVRQIPGLETPEMAGATERVNLAPDPMGSVDDVRRKRFDELAQEDAGRSELRNRALDMGLTREQRQAALDALPEEDRRRFRQSEKAVGMVEAGAGGLVNGVGAAGLAVRGGIQAGLDARYADADPDAIENLTRTDYAVLSSRIDQEKLGSQTLAEMRKALAKADRLEERRKNELGHIEDEGLIERGVKSVPGMALAMTDIFTEGMGDPRAAFKGWMMQGGGSVLEDVVRRNPDMTEEQFQQARKASAVAGAAYAAVENAFSPAFMVKGAGGALNKAIMNKLSGRLSSKLARGGVAFLVEGAGETSEEGVQSFITELMADAITDTLATKEGRANPGLLKAMRENIKANGKRYAAQALNEMKEAAIPSFIMGGLPGAHTAMTTREDLPPETKSPANNVDTATEMPVAGGVSPSLGAFQPLEAQEAQVQPLEGNSAVVPSIGNEAPVIEATPPRLPPSMEVLRGAQARQAAQAQAMGLGAIEGRNLEALNSLQPQLQETQPELNNGQDVQEQQAVTTQTAPEGVPVPQVSEGQSAQGDEPGAVMQGVTGQSVDLIDRLPAGYVEDTKDSLRELPDNVRELALGKLLDIEKRLKSIESSQSSRLYSNLVTLRSNLTAGATILKSQTNKMNKGHKNAKQERIDYAKELIEKFLEADLNDPDYVNISHDGDGKGISEYNNAEIRTNAPERRRITNLVQSEDGSESGLAWNDAIIGTSGQVVRPAAPDHWRASVVDKYGQRITGFGSTRERAIENATAKTPESEKRYYDNHFRQWTRFELEQIVNGKDRLKIRSIARARGVDGANTKRFSSLVDDIVAAQAIAKYKNAYAAIIDADADIVLNPASFGLTEQQAKQAEIEVETKDADLAEMEDDDPDDFDYEDPDHHRLTFDEMEDEPGSPEAILAKHYSQFIAQNQDGADAGRYLQVSRQSLAYAGMDFKNDEVTDKQLLDAGKDAYERRSLLRERYKNRNEAQPGIPAQGDQSPASLDGGGGSRVDVSQQDQAIPNGQGKMGKDELVESRGGVWYHGSFKKGIETLSPRLERIPQSTMDAPFIWLSSSKPYAEIFATDFKPSGEVIGVTGEVYERVIDTSKLNLWEGSYDELSDYFKFSAGEDANVLRQRMIDDGFDGVRLTDKTIDKSLLESVGEKEHTIIGLFKDVDQLQTKKQLKAELEAAQPDRQEPSTLTKKQLKDELVAAGVVASPATGKTLNSLNKTDLMGLVKRVRRGELGNVNNREVQNENDVEGIEGTGQGEQAGRGVLNEGEKVKREPTEAQERVRRERARKWGSSQPEWQYWRTHQYIKTPKPGERFYEELMGKSAKEPGVIPRRYFRKNAILSWDQVITSFDSQFPNILSPDEMDVPDTLAKIFLTKIPTVAEAEASDKKFWDDRFNADMLDSMRTYLSDGVDVPEEIKAQHPDLYEKALRYENIEDPSALKPGESYNPDVDDADADFEFGFNASDASGKPAFQIELEAQIDAMESRPVPEDPAEYALWKDALRKARKIVTDLEDNFDLTESDVELARERWAKELALMSKVRESAKSAKGQGMQQEMFAQPGQQDMFTGGYASPYPSAVGGGGDVGSYATIEDDPARSRLPLELPELVFLVEKLTDGDLPVVMRRIRALGGRAAGLFRPDGAGRIEIKASMYELVQPDVKQRLRAEAQAFAEKRADFEMGPNDPNRAAFVKTVADGKYEELYDAAFDEAIKSDPVAARKVLAHEIMHLVDYLPDRLLKRGNIFGHIAAFKNSYRKHVMAINPKEEMGERLTQKEQTALRKQAETILQEEMGSFEEIVRQIIVEEPIFKTVGVTPEVLKSLMGMSAREDNPALYEWFATQPRQVKKDVLRKAMQGMVDERLAAFSGKEQVGTRKVTKTVRERKGRMPTKDEIQERFQELLYKEMEARNIEEMGLVKDELRGLIAWWNGTDTMPAYYNTAVEMYAEAGSVWLNNPEAVRKRAPRYYRLMDNWIRERADVAENLNELENLIVSGGVQESRSFRLQQGFDESTRRVLTKQNRLEKSTKQERRDAAKYTWLRKTQPLYDALGKSSGSWSVKNAIGHMRYVKLHHDLAQKDLMRTVFEPLEAAGVNAKFLREYLFYNRVFFERFDKANPGGISPAAARAGLDGIRNQLSEEQWVALQESALWLRKVYEDHALKPLREFGILDENFQKFLEDNVFYATFKVSKRDSVNKIGDFYLEDAIRSSFGESGLSLFKKQFGTHQDIEDPVVATIDKMFALMDFAYTNRAIQQSAEELLKQGTGVAQVAKRAFNGRAWVPQRSKGRVETLVYVKKGKMYGVHVPTAIYNGLVREPDSIANKWAIEHLKRYKDVQSALYTTFNYGFMLMNPFRDFSDFLYKMPNTRLLGERSVFKYIYPAWKASLTSFTNDPNPEARKAMERGLIIPDASFRGHDIFSSEYEKMGIVEAESQWKLQFEKFLDGYSKLNQITERMWKIAGMIYMDEHFPGMPEGQKQWIIHKNAGSPDFLERSGIPPQYDVIFMFYNPGKEGLMTLGAKAKDEPIDLVYKFGVYQAPKVMFRWSLRNGMVSASLIALAALLGDDDEEKGKLEKAIAVAKDLEDKAKAMPLRDLMVYDSLPLWWDDKEQGKVAYIRRPMGHAEQILSVTLYNIFDASLGDDMNAWDMVSGFANAAGEQLPGMNPHLSIAANSLMIIGGVAPIDFSMMRPMFYNKDLNDDPNSLEGWKEFAKWTSNQVTGGMLGRLQNTPLGEEKTDLEKGLNSPVISNTIGRFVKVSNRGEYEEMQKMGKEQEAIDRKVRREARDAVKTYYEKGAFAPGDIQRFVRGNKIINDFSNAKRSGEWKTLPGQPYEDAKFADSLNNAMQESAKRKRLTPGQRYMQDAPVSVRSSIRRKMMEESR